MKNTYTLGHDDVFYSKGRTPVQPAPGGIEEICLETLAHCRDRSVLSNEIFDASRTPLLREHLSPLRANILRPLEALLRGRAVLELGASCGGLTRYLGETAASVTAVENDPAKARVAALRCSDLGNVRIVCDSPFTFQASGPFDLVLAVGLPEYARVLAPDLDNPELELFRAARRHLDKGGHVITAMENRMGLSYLSGIMEPHTGTSYFGLHGRYGRGSAITLGRGELASLLVRAGFGFPVQFVPLPEYLCPVTVLHPSSLEPDAAIDIRPLILNGLHYDRKRPNRLSFSRERAFESAVDNALMEDLCDSLCFIASADNAPLPLDASILASHYGGARYSNFAKETVFVKKGGSVTVSRRFLSPNANRSFRGVSVAVEPEEPYTNLKTLQTLLLPVCNTPGWTVGDLAAWAAPWVRHLDSLAVASPEGAMLPGTAIDMIPANVFRDADGGLIPFDAEWAYEGGQPVPLAFVAVRGLYFSLAGLDTVSAPAEGTPLLIAELVTRVLAKNGVKVPLREMETLMEQVGAFARATVGGTLRLRTFMEKSLGTRALS